MRLVGSHSLESVVIGQGCFSRLGFDPHKGWNPKGHFYLRDCERLRELKIGRFSFKKYSVCEIENNPSLEVIEMRDTNEDSRCFKHSSLELKSD